MTKVPSNQPSPLTLLGQRTPNVVADCRSRLCVKLQVAMPQHTQASGGNRYPAYNTQQWMVGDDRQQLHQQQPHPFLRCVNPPSPFLS